MISRAYLATSYTWKSPLVKIPVLGKYLHKLVMAVRYWRVTKATAKLMEAHLDVVDGEVVGYNIFSPITHSHHIPKWIPERLNTHTFWLGLDFDWIYSCDELWVYMQPGWERSYGVNEELKLAREEELPIRFFDYKTYKEYPADEILNTLDF